MTLWGEMIPQHDAQPDDGQEKGAQQHVQSMEPGQNEEGIAIDAGIQPQPEIPIGMQILITLPDYP